MSPLLDVQKRLRTVGRLRAGHTTNGRPSRLLTWRLTSQDQALVEAAAGVYGGNPQPWNEQWEVITEASTLNVLVPPGQVLIQTWELWRGPACERRCDGEREEFSDGPCLCPADLKDRYEQGKQGKACRPTSRLNVVLPDLPAVGTWRLDTRSWWAAEELPAVAGILSMLANIRNGMVPATLRIEPRTTKKAGGPTQKYAVPVLDLPVTLRQVFESLGVEPLEGLADARALPSATVGEENSASKGLPEQPPRVASLTSPTIARPAAGPDLPSRSGVRPFVHTPPPERFEPRGDVELPTLPRTSSPSPEEQHGPLVLTETTSQTAPTEGGGDGVDVAGGGFATDPPGPRPSTPAQHGLLHQLARELNMTKDDAHAMVNRASFTELTADEASGWISVWSAERDAGRADVGAGGDRARADIPPSILDVGPAPGGEGAVQAAAPVPTDFTVTSGVHEGTPYSVMAREHPRIFVQMAKHLSGERKEAARAWIERAGITSSAHPGGKQ